MTRIRRFLAVLSLVLAAGAAAAAPDAYPFAVAPGDVFGKVAGLEAGSGPKSDLTADERALFADARDGKFDQFSFADACLMAGGVTDPAARKTYLARLDRIEADARAALAGAATAAEKADRLLQFLHAGPMAKGYRAEQTDLHVLLDTGTFNCVSSAVLYNVVGRRVGLDLQAVEVPGHVFAVLYDGARRTDVETTNKDGFDPDRNKAAKAAGKAPAERHAGRRREVGEAGLAAVVAYNHGVALAKAKAYRAAVLANVRALALDPANPAAAQNAVAGLTNWPADLAKAGRYEEALAVLAVGREVVGDGKGSKGGALRANAVAVYDAWAQGHMKRGEWAEAIEVYERGLAALPGDKHLAHNLAYCRQEEGRPGKAPKAR
jgi:tetratricopeptide (TPR) repeat protein